MKNILIADDSVTIIKLLTVYLNEYFGKDEIKIFKAKDGAEALFTLHDNADIEFIFLDIMMPVVDGYSVAKYIHSRELKMDTIVISSNLDKEMITSLAKMGFKNFLPKPIRNDRLIAVLEKLEENPKEEPSKKEMPKEETLKEKTSTVEVPSKE